MPGKQMNPGIVAVTVMLGTFMEALDTSVANVALPHIAVNASAPLDELPALAAASWVTTALFLTIVRLMFLLKGAPIHRHAAAAAAV